jgi:hypothetical protein
MRFLMQRFYLQVYLSFLGILLLFGVLVSVFWILMPDAPLDHRRLEGIGALISTVLPSPDRPTIELQATAWQTSSLST